MAEGTVGYLGPAGTFTEEAALRHVAGDPERVLKPLTSISAVGTAVKTGMVAEGVVPIENSLEGSVAETLDLLIHESPRIWIAKELVLSIRHCLLSKDGVRAEQIELVYSHPQALAQCRRFLERVFPKARLEASLSTSVAVQHMLALDRPAAAIGTERAAGLYGAKIWAQNIQDEEANRTRFVVLAAHDSPPTGVDRTSVACYIARDRPGALRDILNAFAERSLNLSKIESRPSKESLGRYFFLLDVEGHREDEAIRTALADIEGQDVSLRVLGSYPRYVG